MLRTSKTTIALRRASAIDSVQVQVLVNKGATLIATGHLDEALESYQQAAALTGDDVGMLNRFATELFNARRYGHAFACYEQLAAMEPNSAEAHRAQAVTLIQLNRFDEALVAAQRALAIRPNYLDALYASGLACARLQRFDEASAWHERILSIDPHYPWVLGELAHCYLCMCAWDSLARVSHELERQTADGKSLFTPFILLGFPIKPAEMLSCTKRFVDATIPKPAPWRHARKERDRPLTGRVSVRALSSERRKLPHCRPV